MYGSLVYLPPPPDLSTTGASNREDSPYKSRRTCYTRGPLHLGSIPYQFKPTREPGLEEGTPYLPHPPMLSLSLRFPALLHIPYTPPFPLYRPIYFPLHPLTHASLSPPSSLFPTPSSLPPSSHSTNPYLSTHPTASPLLPLHHPLPHTLCPQLPLSTYFDSNLAGSSNRLYIA